MYEASVFCQELERLGADFYVGVPDTVIKHLCNYLTLHAPHGGHIIAANEGGAIGLATGYFLATGKIPVVYMQNSGIGNAVNPLLSLADPDVFAIPMLLLIGWRGEPGIKDEPQHMKQGRVSQAMFESMDIPCGILGPDFDEAKQVLATAFDHMRSKPGPYALLVRNKCFAPVDPVEKNYAGPDMTREQAIQVIINAFDDKTAFVASTGMGPRELYELRDAAGQSHERDFLNAGAMGHASQIAAGIAQAQPGRRVVCIDGDGALFMHLGGLALIPSLGCKKLIHVVINNGVHDSVGGQPNLASSLDACSLARVCGYGQTHQVEHKSKLVDALEQCKKGPGPGFIEVLVARGFRSDLGRPKIPFAEAAQQFKTFLHS